MAYAEKRGKGPKPWRVKYKRPDGSEASESGFETKKAALTWGRDQEAQIRYGSWTDPQAGEITVDTWTGQWMSGQDVGISTTDNREYLIRRFIRPQWGGRALMSLAADEINAWEKGLPAAEDVSARTARDARSLLCTILGDAAAAKPPRIPFNPALRPRNRGRKTGRRLVMNPPRTWATPLESLLIAERASLLSGRDTDFVMLITIPYTGMRWGEVIGLERELCLPALINVEWQLREVNGHFYRLPPKDDSYRSVNWEPRIPVDLPPFLTALLATQAGAVPASPCQCASGHGGSGRYVFTGPDGGHPRRSTTPGGFSAPHAMADTNRSAGVPASWSSWTAPTGQADPSQAGHRPSPALPSSRQPAGATRSSSTATLTTGGVATGRCPACGRSVRWRADGGLAAHRVKDAQCPGSGRSPAEDPALAAWLPVKAGLTAHGFRHSHKTWMVEDGVPEILAELRLGHEVPGMRGLYSHVSERMRQELKDALQARWDESLKERAALAPRSLVPALDRLLAPLRVASLGGGENLASQIPPTDGSGTISRVA